MTHIFALYKDRVISTRTYHCLKNSNIETLEHLCELTQADLLRIENFGRKSLHEIEEILTLRGMCIRRHPFDPRSTPEGEKLYQKYILAKVKWDIHVAKFQKEELSQRLRKPEC